MIKEADLSNFKVLMLYPNQRTVSLVPPSLALFSSLLKERNAEVKLFDTTFYRMDCEDSDKAREKNLTVHPVNEASLVIEYHNGNVFEDLCKVVEDFRPNIILATATDSTFPLALDLFKAVQKYKSQYHFLTLLGGVFATFAPERSISYPEIDIICVGEGEGPLIDLCDRLCKGESYDDIPNIWLKTKEGTIVKNKVRPPADISELPSPDFSIFDEKRLYRMMGGKVYKMLPIETHRGCPYMCTYCGSPTQNRFYLEQTSSKFYREKLLREVKEDLLFQIKKWKPTYIFFWADTFLAYSEEKIDEFCEFYSKIKIPFYCQARPETITESKIIKLKAVGLDRVGVGIEHGNEQYRSTVLKRYYKNSQVIECMEIVRKHGISFSLNNIIGLPDETPELAMDTVELNRSIKGFEDSSCSIFQPYYGTPLRALCVEKGYISPDLICPHNASDSLLNMPSFPKERISGLARTFSLYIRLPKDRWDEIKVAEKFTEEGNAMFEKLSQEVIEKFFVPESDL